MIRALGSRLSLRDRISGGIFGLLIGDALGVPYEFHPPSALPPLDDIEFETPPGFARAHAGVPPGTWSDDGAQALCLLASLLYRGRLEPQDFGNRLVNWHDFGYFAVNGVVFDVGNQTAEAIRHLRNGVPPLLAGGEDEHSQGNGSLMRVLPLALWHKGTDTELVRDAHDQSCVTHRHPTVQACCALYCLWARVLMADTADPWRQAVATLREIYRDFPDHLQVFEKDIRPDSDRPGGGTGYVVDSLLSARQALEAGPYDAVVKAAVAFGHDTDTTACIAGGLAGLRDGIDAIPLRWRQSLLGQDEVRPMLDGLLEHWR